MWWWVYVCICTCLDISGDDDDSEGEEMNEEAPSDTLQQMQAKLEDEKQMILQNTEILAEVSKEPVVINVCGWI